MNGGAADSDGAVDTSWNRWQMLSGVNPCVRWPPASSMSSGRFTYTYKESSKALAA